MSNYIEGRKGGKLVDYRERMDKRLRARMEERLRGRDVCMCMHVYCTVHVNVC